VRDRDTSPVGQFGSYIRRKCFFSLLSLALSFFLFLFLSTDGSRSVFKTDVSFTALCLFRESYVYVLGNFTINCNVRICVCVCVCMYLYARVYMKNIDYYIFFILGGTLTDYCNIIQRNMSYVY
jgi:hypothetical protein